MKGFRPIVMFNQCGASGELNGRAFPTIDAATKSLQTMLGTIDGAKSGYVIDIDLHDGGGDCIVARIGMCSRCHAVFNGTNVTWEPANYPCVHEWGAPTPALLVEGWLAFQCVRCGITQERSPGKEKRETIMVKADP